MAHWTRKRDLDRNEACRLEALVYILFSRQIIYYQARQGLHSSFENPPGSVAWDIDIVKEMIGPRVGRMGLIETDSCAWGAKDPVSGKYYGKAFRFACTFDMQTMRRRCTKDHEHEVVQGRIREGLYKGRHRSAISGRYPLQLCQVWTSLAKGLLAG